MMWDRPAAAAAAPSKSRSGGNVDNRYGDTYTEMSADRGCYASWLSGEGVGYDPKDSPAAATIWFTIWGKLIINNRLASWTTAEKAQGLRGDARGTAFATMSGKGVDGDDRRTERRRKRSGMRRGAACPGQGGIVPWRAIRTSPR